MMTSLRKTIAMFAIACLAGSVVSPLAAGVLVFGPDADPQVVADGPLPLRSERMIAPGNVVWMTPADMDRSTVTCTDKLGVVEEPFSLGPDTAERRSTSSHGDLRFLTETRWMVRLTCTGPGLESLLVSPVEHPRRDLLLALVMVAASPILFLTGRHLRRVTAADSDA